MAFNLLAALLAVSPSGTAQGSHLLDQLHLLECSRQVILVAKHQDRNASEGRLAEQFVQLVPRFLHGLRVSRINNIPAPPTILSVCCSRAGCSQRLLWLAAAHHSHNCADTAAVSLPHPAEARLATELPQLDSHIPPFHLAHVVAYSRDSVLYELSDL